MAATTESPERAPTVPTARPPASVAPTAGRAPHRLPPPPATRSRPRPPVPDLAPARRDLRRQIAALERTWAGLLGEAPAGAPAAIWSGPIGTSSPAPRAGRLLGLAELETGRDRLVAAIERARDGMRVEHARRAAARRRLEAMLADPARHRFYRVSQEELGVSGCGVYEVRPRLGLIGMLAGWWEVKLSSGCP